MLGKVAVEYGPIVYCAEGIDNDQDVLSAKIPLQSEFRSVFNSELLRGIPIIISGNEEKTAGSPIDRENELTLIPYNVWNNRGSGKMAVWFDTN